MALRGAVVGLLLIVVAAPSRAQEKQPPYWASIASGLALTHTGPGRTYPNVWLYQRRDLPVRVVKKYETWRLIQDPDGAQGWMLVTMLSDHRTAIVKPGHLVRSVPIRVTKRASATAPSRASSAASANAGAMAGAGSKSARRTDMCERPTSGVSPTMRSWTETADPWPAADPNIWLNRSSRAVRSRFSSAVRVGDILFLSGQMGFGADGKLAQGIAGQARQALENIRTVLADAGLGFTDVFRCTVMLADMAQWPAFNEVYLEYFSAPSQRAAHSGRTASPSAVSSRSNARLMPARTSFGRPYSGIDNLA